VQHVLKPREALARVVLEVTHLIAESAELAAQRVQLHGQPVDAAVAPVQDRARRTGDIESLSRSPSIQAAEPSAIAVRPRRGRRTLTYFFASV
jgi:hypothetical protein